MEKVEIHCEKCNDTTLHTIRFYETKTKHYSVVSFGSDKHVTIICHTCLLESKVDSETEKKLVKKYEKELVAGQAFEFLMQNKHGKAEKIFKNILVKDNENAQATYGLAKCLIAQGRYEEAKNYVEKLVTQYPAQDEVMELKKSLDNVTP